MNDRTGASAAQYREKRQYTALFQEFATLNLYWKEFLELFATNDKRIDRLNRAAPGFFRMLKDQQFETNLRVG
jgi:hypothetical protein